MTGKDFSNLRTGVLGVGSMGQNHARIYNEISNLVAVVDPDEAQGRSVSERFSVAWYGDYREMLDEVDAVTIAVPTALHREVAEAVIEAGVHLLVEKPLAGNVADAKAIMTAAEAAGVTLAVGHVERHNPVVAYAKEAIERGEWGDVITMSSRRVSSFPARINDVGVLLDLSIHDIDISTYLAGSDVVSVYVVGGSMKASHEDYVNIMLEHESGLISTCETNWLTPMKIRKLGITTSRLYVELDYQHQSAQLFKSRYVDLDESNLYTSTSEFESHSIPIEKKEPLMLELNDFLSSIQNNRAPLVTGSDGLSVVMISEIALTSLKLKKVVDLLDVHD
jgi:UDP-N-acetylglucosamine 3-dehydrogenase